MNRYITFLLLGTICLTLCSCKTHDTHQFAPALHASSDAPAPGHARIYIMRKNSFVGRAVPMLAFDGDTAIGSYGADGYLAWDRPTGRVELTVAAIRKAALDMSISEKKSRVETVKLYAVFNRDQTPMSGSLSFEILDGKTYYVLQTTRFIPSSSHAGDIQLELASEVEGLRYLKQRNPAK